MEHDHVYDEIANYHWICIDFWLQIYATDVDRLVHSIHPAFVRHEDNKVDN